MPIKIKGMAFRPVQLPELRDAVFFGQTKVYDDVQRSTCPSLQSAIKAGLLAVLEETPLVIPMVSPSAFPAPQPLYKAPPPVVLPQTFPAPQPAPTAMDMDAMAARVVEAVTANVVAAMAAQQNHSVAPPPAPADNGTAQAITALSRKIDGLSVSGVGVTRQTTMTSSDVSPTDEVYIPTINVDDMHNNIKLESRSLGQGGQVNSALAALRNLKNKQNP